MPSISITDSFDCSLHDGVNNGRSPVAHISGTATALADEPHTCSEINYRYWNEEAQAVLTHTQNYLDTHRLASFEPTRRFETEGDVADAAAVHLTNPVELALDAQYPDRVAVYNQPTYRTARADRVYSFAGSAEEIHPFAVMDYKAQGVIRPYEIRNAFDPRRGAFSGPQYNENILVLLKQAVHYACVYHTRYVCFFDYNSLLLIYLTDAVMGSNPPLGGDTAQMTLVTDKRRMRRALLGFLALAYTWRVEEDSMARGYGGGRVSRYSDTGYDGNGGGRSGGSARIGSRYTPQR